MTSHHSDNLTCSANRCTAAARWELRWNNPKLHPPERRKVWLACDEHREHLADFLNRRAFLREIEPIQTAVEPTSGVDPATDPTTQDPK
jgi:hypothetical protein